MGKETKNAYTHNLYSRFNEPFSQLPRLMYIKKFNPIKKKKIYSYKKVIYVRK